MGPARPEPHWSGGGPSPGSLSQRPPIPDPGLVPAGWPCWWVRPGATGRSSGGRSHAQARRAQPHEGVSPKDTIPKPRSSRTLARPKPGLPTCRSKKVAREAAVTKNHVGATQEGWLGRTTSHREGTCACPGQNPPSPASPATTSGQGDRGEADCGSFCELPLKDGRPLWSPSFFSSPGLLRRPTHPQGGLSRVWKEPALKAAVAPATAELTFPR